MSAEFLAVAWALSGGTDFRYTARVSLVRGDLIFLIWCVTPLYAATHNRIQRAVYNGTAVRLYLEFS